MKSNILNLLALFLFVGTISVWQSEQITFGKLTDSNNNLFSNFISPEKIEIQTKEARVKEIADSHVFLEFDTWIKQFADGKFSATAEQNQAGEELVVKRRRLLKQLIEIDPETALEKTIPAKDLNRLPKSIIKNLEKRISAYGDFNVYVFDEVDSATGKMSGFRTEREVIVGGESRYKAFVYGRRETMTAKTNIPLQGIVIEDVMAVDENPVRKLESSEITAHQIDISSSDQTTIAAEIGGKVTGFANQAALDEFVHGQIAWESKIGPVRPNSVNNENKLSPWTEGVKKVLFIRVDFPDRQGVPIDASNNQPLTEDRVLNLMNNEVSPFYVNSSYDKTSIQTTVTPVIRLPQPQSYYIQNNATIGQQEADARIAARAAGFETNNFDLDIVGFSNTQGFAWAGIGCSGCKGLQINGNFSAWIIDHELGHNYGLPHASAWRTTDGTIIGQGNHVEGGYPFDIMGGGTTLTSALNHFNARYKLLLNWLTDDNIQTVTTDGVYRIFAEDAFEAGGTRGLKIRKNSSRNYWVEYRQLFNNSPIFTSGAIISWDAPATLSPQVELLDMTPNTQTANDAPLLIGQSFYDDVNRIKITVVGKENTTPESLDVRIELNVGCSFTIGQTMQNVLSSGGEGSISINTQSGCSIPAASNNDWIFGVRVDDSNGAVRYTTSTNYASQPRNGSISIAGQIFIINQSSSTTACIAPPSGIAAWWRAEGNALDETKSNNGTLVNNILFGGGRIGGGFMPDGTQDKKILVPNSNSLAFSGSMTIEGWIKLNSFSMSGRKSVIVRKDDATENYIIYVTGNGKLWFAFSNVVNSGAVHGVESLQSLSLNEFYHFAATLDDSTGQVKFYLNGSLVNSITTPARPFANLDPVKNPRVELGGSGFDGIIDELSVYNRSLSASEIQAVYNAGTAATGATGKCPLTSTTVKSRKRVRFF